MQGIFQRKFSNVTMDLVCTNQTSQAHVGQGGIVAGPHKEFSRIERKSFEGYMPIKCPII